MNIDQRSLQDGSSVVGHDDDSPTYRILYNQFILLYSIRSEVSCCEKNNPPSSMDVGIDEGRNEYQGIQNVKTTGSLV